MNKNNKIIMLLLSIVATIALIGCESPTSSSGGGSKQSMTFTAAPTFTTAGALTGVVITAAGIDNLIENVANSRNTGVLLSYVDSGVVANTLPAITAFLTNPANYTPITGATFAINAAAKTITATFPAIQVVSGYAIGVSILADTFKNTDGSIKNTLSSFVSTPTAGVTRAGDTTVPTVVSISAVPGTKTVTVKFSEPVTVGNTAFVPGNWFLLSGPVGNISPNAATAVAYGINRHTLVVTSTNNFVEGNQFQLNIVVAAGVTDLAGTSSNALAAYTNTPTGFTETNKPAFTVANIATTATTLVLTASEAITRKVADDTALRAGIAVTYKKVAAGSTKADNTAVPLTAATVTGTNQITLTFAALTGVSATDKLAINLNADLVQDNAVTPNGNASVALEATLQ